MARKFPNNDKQNLMKRDENSDEDLIQFSHSESYSGKEKHDFDKQTFKQSSQHTAAVRTGTNYGQQQPTEIACTRSKIPAHTNQAIFPPNVEMSCSGNGERESTSMYKTKKSSDRHAGSHTYSTRVAGNRQSPIDMTTDVKGAQKYDRTRVSGNINSRQNKNKLQKNPTYKTFKARVSSFDLWPIQIKQNKEEMADAGLYYTGSDDLVRCFQCDGKLRGWEVNDDVWTEHARLFPLCPHVWTNKGEEFISRVQATIKEEEDIHGRGNFKEIRDATLEMGFSELKFLCAYRHLKNFGTSEPTLDEIVESLCKLNN